MHPDFSAAKIEKKVRKLPSKYGIYFPENKEGCKWSMTIVLILCINTVDGRICVKFTFVIYS